MKNSHFKKYFASVLVFLTLIGQTKSCAWWIFDKLKSSKEESEVQTDFDNDSNFDKTANDEKPDVDDEVEKIINSHDQAKERNIEKSLDEKPIESEYNFKEKEHAKNEYDSTIKKENKAFKDYFEICNNIKQVGYDNKEYYNSYLVLTMDINKLICEKLGIEDLYNKSLIEFEKYNEIIGSLSDRISELKMQQSRYYMLYCSTLSKIKILEKKREEKLLILQEAQKIRHENLQNWKNVCEASEIDNIER